MIDTEEIKRIEWYNYTHYECERSNSVEGERKQEGQLKSESQRKIK